MTTTAPLPFWTVARLAEHLAVSERTIYALFESGKLASYTVGRSRRIADEDVQRYLASRREG